MLITGARELRASPSLPTLAATAPKMWKGLGWAVECWWELRAGSALKAFLFGKSCKHGISSEVESSPCLLPARSFFLKLSWMMTLHVEQQWSLLSVDISKYPDAWHQWRKENKSHMMNWVCHTFPQCFGVTYTMASVAGPSMTWLHLF